MAKKGMSRLGGGKDKKNNVKPVPEIQGKAKTTKDKAENNNDNMRD